MQVVNHGNNVVHHLGNPLDFRFPTARVFVHIVGAIIAEFLTGVIDIPPDSTRIGSPHPQVQKKKKKGYGLGIPECCKTADRQLNVRQYMPISM
jgi:hypothetical protein